MPNPTLDSILAALESGQLTDTQKEFWMGQLKTFYPDTYKTLMSRITATPKRQGAPSTPTPIPSSPAGQVAPWGNMRAALATVMPIPAVPAVPPATPPLDQGKEGDLPVGSVVSEVDLGDGMKSVEIYLGYNRVQRFTVDTNTGQKVAEGSPYTWQQKQAAVPGAGVREFESGGSRYVIQTDAEGKDIPGTIERVGAIKEPEEKAPPVPGYEFSDRPYEGQTLTDAEGLYQWKLNAQNRWDKVYLPTAMQPQKPATLPPGQWWTEKEAMDANPGVPATDFQRDPSTNGFYVKTAPPAKAVSPGSFATLREAETAYPDRSKYDIAPGTDGRYYVTPRTPKDLDPNWAKTEAEKYMAEQTANWQWQQNFDYTRLKDEQNRKSLAAQNAQNRAWDMAQWSQTAGMQEQQSRRQEAARAAEAYQNREAALRAEEMANQRWREQQAELKNQRLAALAANPKSWIEYAANKGPGYLAAVQSWMEPLGGGKTGAALDIWRRPALPDPASDAMMAAQQPSAILGSITGEEANAIYQRRRAAAGPNISDYQLTADPVNSGEIEAVKVSRWGGGGGGTPALDMSLLPELTRPSPQYMADMSPASQEQYAGYQQAKTGMRPEDLANWLRSYAPGMTGTTRYQR